MTDQTSSTGSTPPSGSPADAAPPAAAPPAAAPPPPSFEERIDRFAHETEDAGKRLASNPAVVDAANTAARVWGLLLIGVGLWFLAEVTLGYDLPAIPWRDIWPLGLIVIGLAVVFRGMSRRSA